jgi:hypothetical protein
MGSNTTSLTPKAKRKWLLMAMETGQGQRAELPVREYDVIDNLYGRVVNAPRLASAAC